MKSYTKSLVRKGSMGKALGKAMGTMMPMKKPMTSGAVMKKGMMKKGMTKKMPMSFKTSPIMKRRAASRAK